MRYKRPPTMKIGNYLVKYKQILYEDRYFFIYYDRREIAKIPYHLERHNFAYRLMDLGRDRRWEVWYKFLERVEKYNEYLDNADE